MRSHAHVSYRATSQLLPCFAHYSSMILLVWKVNNRSKRKNVVSGHTLGGTNSEQEQLVGECVSGREGDMGMIESHQS